MTMMRKNNQAKILLYILLAILALMVLYPIFWIFINSFKSTSELLENSFNIPEILHFENYVRAWKSGLSGYFLNSILLSVVSIFFITLISSLAAYGLTRFKFKLRGLLFTAILCGMSLSIESSFVPLFKMYQVMHLYNTRIGIIILYVAFRVPITVFLMRSYFLSFPKDIEEAARIDGCGSFGIYWRMILPIGKPILASSALVNMIFTWNEFMTALIFLKDKAKMTIPVGLTALKGEALQQWNIQLAAVVIASLPMIIAFLCMQKAFVNGLTAGSVKG